MSGEGSGSGPRKSAAKAKTPKKKIYDAKTKPTESDVAAFIAAIDDPQKRADALRLLEIFSDETGEIARMWGPSIIGFGVYSYTYESGHAGQAPLTGFSPRKAALSLYIMPGFASYGDLLARLGKYKIGKACLYLKALKEADEAVLRRLIALGFQAQKARWGA